MKGDDVVAVEKSLESEAWVQLWTLRITHLQPGEPWPTDSPGGAWRAASLEAGCVLAAAAWVMRLLDKWDRWPGNVDCLSGDPALLRVPPSGQGCGWEGGAPFGNHALHSCLLRPGRPGLRRVIHRVRAPLPVSDGRCPPCTMPEVFPQPWRQALTEGWGPWAPFSSHSSWPGSLCGHRGLRPHPVLWVTRDQTCVWLGALYKH